MGVTFAVDRTTKDILFQNGGLVRVEKIEATRRLVEKAILDVQEEWFEDPARGIPWFDEDNAEILIERLKTTVMTVDQVVEILTFDYQTTGDTLIVTQVKIRTLQDGEQSLGGFALGPKWGQPIGVMWGSVATTWGVS